MQDYYLLNKNITEIITKDDMYEVIDSKGNTLTGKKVIVALGRIGAKWV